MSLEPHVVPQNKEVLKKILKDEDIQRVTGDSLKEFPSLKKLSNK